MNAPASATTQLAGSLTDHQGRSTGARVTLAYVAADPYAIGLTITIPHSTVTWLIGRDLLHHGIAHTPTQVGDGDVTITVAWQRLFVGIRDGHGSAILNLPLLQVHDFLRSTCRIVPPGTETQHVDVDGLVDALLDEEAAS